VKYFGTGKYCDIGSTILLLFVPLSRNIWIVPVSLETASLVERKSKHIQNIHADSVPLRNSAEIPLFSNTLIKVPVLEDVAINFPS
jgi:hypothetical protein